MIKCLPDQVHLPLTADKIGLNAISDRHPVKGKPVEANSQIFRTDESYTRFPVKIEFDSASKLPGLMRRSYKERGQIPTLKKVKIAAGVNQKPECKKSGMPNKSRKLNKEIKKKGSEDYRFLTDSLNCFDDKIVLDITKEDLKKKVKKKTPNDAKKDHCYEAEGQKSKFKASKI